MKKKLFSILSVILLFCFLLSGCQELSDYAADLLDAKCDEMMVYFNDIAFDSDNDVNVVQRWEMAVRIKVMGDYTDDDYSALTKIIGTLNDLGSLPDISIADENTNCYLHFLPLDKMAATIPYYKEGDWRRTTIYWNGKHEIYKAYTGIATDVTTQVQRNNQIIVALVSSMGLLGTSDKYPNSIFYSEWTDAQSLSDMDSELIRMLYSPSLHAGMSEEAAEITLMPLVKAKYIDTYLD